jgi:hypothetical protein
MTCSLCTTAELSTTAFCGNKMLLGSVTTCAVADQAGLLRRGVGSSTLPNTGIDASARVIART